MHRGSGINVSCGVGCICGLEPTLVWLWHRLAATAPVRPLARELPYAVGAALKKGKKSGGWDFWIKELNVVKVPITFVKLKLAFWCLLYRYCDILVQSPESDKGGEEGCGIGLVDEGCLGIS